MPRIRIGSFLPHIPEQTIPCSCYRYAVELARSKGAEVVLLPLVPIDAKKYFSWISRDKNADNILQWLGDVSMLSRWQEHYSRLVEGLAEELRCPIIDIRRDFLLSHQFETLLCSDGIHPTPAGHEMIADAWPAICKRHDPNNSPAKKNTRKEQTV